MCLFPSLRLSCVVPLLPRDLLKLSSQTSLVASPLVLINSLGGCLGICFNCSSSPLTHASPVGIHYRHNMLLAALFVCPVCVFFWVVAIHAPYWDRTTASSWQLPHYTATLSTGQYFCFLTCKTCFKVAIKIELIIMYILLLYLQSFFFSMPLHCEAVTPLCSFN